MHSAVDPGSARVVSSPPDTGRAYHLGLGGVARSSALSPLPLERPRRRAFARRSRGSRVLDVRSVPAAALVRRAAAIRRRWSGVDPARRRTCRGSRVDAHDARRPSCRGRSVEGHLAQDLVAGREVAPLRRDVAAAAGDTAERRAVNGVRRRADLPRRSTSTLRRCGRCYAYRSARSSSPAARTAAARELPACRCDVFLST